MGEIVNLRQARKKRAMAAAESEAAVNRRVHGRSKNERRASEAERASSKRHIDAHRLQKPADDGR
jgi:hypothetical protein